MDRNELLTTFLNKIETLILDIEMELDRIRKNNHEYNFSENILEALNNSKLDFVVTYHDSSSEMKQAIRELLLNVCQDELEIETIINEINNLYFLYSQSLIDDEDLAEQKEDALEVLENLEVKISQFLSQKELISESAIDSRNEMKQKLIEIGSVFGNGYQSEIIADVKMLDEVINVLHLTEEETLSLIASIIETNTELTLEKIQEEEEKIQEEIETSKEEVEEEIEEEVNNVKEIDIDVLEEINKILSRKDVVEKVVKLINGDAKTIVFSNPNAEEAEIIMSSIELAREYMIDKVLYEDLTPEEALQALYKEHKQSTESILYELNEILEEVQEDIPYQEQIAIINKGTEFYNKNKHLLQNYAKQDRQRVSGYMTSILYKSKDRRLELYRSMSFNDNSKLLADATYEIKILIDLLDSLDRECLEFKDIIKRVSKRIADILDSVRTIENERGIEKPKVEENNRPGRLYYLMRNDRKSMLEADVRPEDINKGISPEYYDDLMEALSSIRNRSTATQQFSIPAQEGDNYLKKNGVQVTNTSRVKVLYIPINKKDSIIVGVGFSDGKQFPLRDQDDRLRRYQSVLNKLRSDIESGNVEREIAISEETDRRIKKALKTPTKKSSLRAMFEEDDEDDKTKQNDGGRGNK